MRVTRHFVEYECGVIIWYVVRGEDSEISSSYRPFSEKSDGASLVWYTLGGEVGDQLEPGKVTRCYGS